MPLSRAAQVLRLSQRQIEFVFRWRRELGDVFRTNGIIRGRPVVTGHPEHVRSLFTAKSGQDGDGLTDRELRDELLTLVLAMAEQRVVLETLARRLDLEAEDPRPERVVHRNVTMIPAGGARVVVRGRRP